MVDVAFICYINIIFEYCHVRENTEKWDTILFFQHNNVRLRPCSWICMYMYINKGDIHIFA